MSGLFGALEIAKRSLLAGQAGLQITGQNIANANTPGYSRKVLEQAPASGARLPEGFLGAGVDATRIARARDEHIESSLLRARSGLGDSSTRAGELRQIESLFGDLEEGSLSQAMERFLQSWNDLSFSTESSSARGAVREAGANVASVLNRLSDGLSAEKNRLREQLPADVRHINTVIEQVAELSRRIGAAEAGSTQAHDLRDERSRAIGELAELVNVNFTEAPNGSFLLRVGGVVVADGRNVIGLDVASQPGTGELSLSAGGVAVTPAGGALKARFEMASSTIPGYLSGLDEIAQGLADSVNAIHQNAFNLSGESGVSFFVTDGTGDGAAARIRLSDEVRDDPAAIAASVNGAPGDNSAALAIAQLGTTPTLRQGTRSVTQLVSDFTQGTAGDTAEAIFLEQAGGALVDSLNNRRDAVAGVSLDEEALNLVKYQQAYEAAARVVSITNQMMETLLREI